MSTINKGFDYFVYKLYMVSTIAGHCILGFAHAYLQELFVLSLCFLGRLL